VPAAVVRRLPQYVLKAGDIVFGRKGAVERSALVTEQEHGWFLGSDGICVRPRDGHYSAYLACQFQRQEVQTWLRQNAIGTTMPSLNQAILGRVTFPYAPLSEQRAIASALSDVDALLEGLTRLIAKKRDLKQAAMQQLLTGQTRLPGFKGEWEVKRIGEVLRFQVGYPFSSVFFNEKQIGIRLIKNRDLKSEDQLFHYSGRFDPAFVVHNGDVLVGMDGDFVLCRWNKGRALLNQRVGRLVPRTDLDAAFAYYALRGPLKAIEDITSRTTVKHLSHSDVEDIERPLPSLPEQSAIAAVLSDMDAELSALEVRREKTIALKQAMMQELLTGRTRLV
jgi:type I restriction enzyme S subunit